MDSFMEQLKNKMTSLKGQKLEPTTIKLYMNNLKRLNNNKDFNSLDYLNDYDGVMKFLDKYKYGTKKNYLTAVLTGLYTDVKYKDIFEKYRTYYYDFIENNREQNNKEVNERIKNKAISWDELIKIKKDNLKKYNKTGHRINLINYFILSLYTDIEPRRSKDYTHMFIVKEYDEKIHNNKDKNYFDLKNNIMVFNNYKTKKNFGQQIIKIENKAFLSALKKYLKFRDISIRSIGDQELPFLVNRNLTHINNEQKLYNTIRQATGHKISSSLLRHIYITEHLGDKYEEITEINEKMGHGADSSTKYVIKSTVV